MGAFDLDGLLWWMDSDPWTDRGVFVARVGSAEMVSDGRVLAVNLDAGARESWPVDVNEIPQANAAAILALTATARNECPVNLHDLRAFLASVRAWHDNESDGRPCWLGGLLVDAHPVEGVLRYLNASASPSVRMGVIDENAAVVSLAITGDGWQLRMCPLNDPEGRFGEGRPVFVVPS